MARRLIFPVLILAFPFLTGFCWPPGYEILEGKTPRGQEIMLARVDRIGVVPLTVEEHALDGKQVVVFRWGDRMVAVDTDANNPEAPVWMNIQWLYDEGLRLRLTPEGETCRWTLDLETTRTAF